MAFHSTQYRYQSYFTRQQHSIRSAPFCFCEYSFCHLPFLHFSQGLFSISQPVSSSGLQAFVLTVPSALIVFPALALLPSYHSHPSLENELFNLKAKHHLHFFFHCTLCFFLLVFITSCNYVSMCSVFICLTDHEVLLLTTVTLRPSTWQTFSKH